MFRTPLIAAVTVALLSGTALAQPATSPPADLSGTARSAPDFDDNDRDDGPPVSARQANPRAQATANEQRDRDVFCRRDAAARTGYTNPRDAARDEQARGSIGGTLGGAALGAIIGGASGDAGMGAAIGAGAGLLAGTAVGSSNARQAARDVEADYSAAYYACMHQADSGPRSAYNDDGRNYDDRPPYGYDRGYDYGPDYAYGPPPPPPPYYSPYYSPYGYFPYGYAPYYGPSISLGFGFGGGHRGWGHNRGFRGGRGGWRHR